MTGKTRGSKHWRFESKSRSSIGSGTRKSSVGASTSVMSSTVIESDDSRASSEDGGKSIRADNSRILYSCKGHQKTR